MRLFATFFFILLCVSLQFAVPASASEDAKQIMRHVYDRANGNDRHYFITMTLINKNGGTRIRKMESFSKDYGKDRKSIMIFRDPADVSGTMFLSWEYDAINRDDDKWLYMPAMKKVRRISGASRNEYFMGSDYTYDDMGKRHPDKDTYTNLGSETVGGHSCWKIECTPVSDDLYTKRIVWVSKEALLVIKADYFDKDGLIKAFLAKDFRKQDGFWSVYVGEMDNVSRNHKTIMTTEQIEYNTGIQDSIFTAATLQRGRI